MKHISLYVWLTVLWYMESIERTEYDRERNFERFCTIEYENNWRQASGVPSVFS